MQLDSNFDSIQTEKDSISWNDVFDSNKFTIYGLFWQKENHDFQRFHHSFLDEIHQISPKVERLSKHTSGAQVHFRTNSKRIAIHAKVIHDEPMSVMTPMAQMGFDCYIGDSFENLQFFDATKYSVTEDEFYYTFTENQPYEDAYVVIHFPLYASVECFVIGIDEQADVHSVDTFDPNQRIIVYGTSITQGASASRPGLSYSNQLSRRMKCEWLNFGFSGNAFGEPGILAMIATIKPAQLLILDYEANAGTNGLLEKTLEDILNVIRKEQPKIEIVVVSRIPYLMDTMNPSLQKRRSEIRQFQKRTVEQWKLKGDYAIHFIDGSAFYETPFDEFTVDSVHPNDLGFQQITNHLEQRLCTILNIRR